MEVVRTSTSQGAGLKFGKDGGSELPFLLHGSKGKGENGVSDCGSHKSCRYRP